MWPGHCCHCNPASPCSCVKVTSSEVCLAAGVSLGDGSVSMTKVCEPCESGVNLCESVRFWYEHLTTTREPMRTHANPMRTWCEHGANTARTSRISRKSRESGVNLANLVRIWCEPGANCPPSDSEIRSHTCHFYYVLVSPRRRRNNFGPSRTWREPVRIW